MVGTTRTRSPSTLLAALVLSSLALGTSGFYTRTLFEPSTLWPALVPDAAKSTEPRGDAGAYPGTAREEFLPLQTPIAVPRSVENHPALPAKHRSMRITCYFRPIQCVMEKGGEE